MPTASSEPLEMHGDGIARKGKSRLRLHGGVRAFSQNHRQNTRRILERFGKELIVARPPGDSGGYGGGFGRRELFCDYVE